MNGFQQCWGVPVELANSRKRLDRLTKRRFWKLLYQGVTDQKVCVSFRERESPSIALNTNVEEGLNAFGMPTYWESNPAF